MTEIEALEKFLKDLKAGRAVLYALDPTRPIDSGADMTCRSTEQLERAMRGARRWRSTPDSPLGPYQRWIAAMAGEIERLQDENAALRAVAEGRVHPLPPLGDSQRRVTCACGDPACTDSCPDCGCVPCQCESGCRCVRADGSTRFNINCTKHGKRP